MNTLPLTWDQETDVIVIGYGFAGATAAITAHDAGSEVLLLEKAPEQHKGGNSRVSANLVFWPDDVAKAKLYFEALAGPYAERSQSAIAPMDPSRARERTAAFGDWVGVAERRDLGAFETYLKAASRLPRHAGHVSAHGRPDQTRSLECPPPGRSRSADGR